MPEVTLQTLAKQIAEFAVAIDARVDNLDARVDNLDATMNARFDVVDERFDAVDHKLARIEVKLDQAIRPRARQPSRKR